MTIIEMLTRNARKYPDDLALTQISPSLNLRRSISWKQLDDNACRFASSLKALGIMKGDRVLLLMKNSIEWLEAYFGIVKTGAWAVPLNFRFTASDIKYCTRISEARAIVLGEEFIDLIDSARPEMVSVEHFILCGSRQNAGMCDYHALLAAGIPACSLIPVEPSDVCAIYFTSGTTGDPKPIVLTHGNMECAAVTEQQHHHQRRNDNFLLLPPLYHTGAKMHWYGSLRSASRAVLLTEISPQNILSTVDAERCSIVWLLVPWAQDILDALDEASLHLTDYDLRCWRLMHIGAQPVPPQLIRHWKAHFPHMEYDTNYGLSESSGPGCVHLGIGNEHKVGAIGLPGFEWQVRIVDDEGNDVAAERIGELLVKGGGVMQEYYKNPQKTLETIQDGWLRTGDIARRDTDGFIYLVDRKKDIIIVGGENIFPVEIEDCLRAHPAIHDAAVIGVPDGRLGEIPLAIIQIKDCATLSVPDIEIYCEQNLPRYKRPRRYVFDEVPRNPTGKIEKPQLRRKYTG